jgi:integrase
LYPKLLFHCAYFFTNFPLVSATFASRGCHLVANMRAKITKSLVDRIEPNGRDAVVWDTEVRGFSLRARTGGAKYYALKYRDPRGKQKWITIGRHGSPWTPETARKKAQELIGRAVGGDDPGAARDTAKAIAAGDLPGGSFGEAVTTFLERHAKKNRSWRETDRIFRVYVLPDWKLSPMAGFKRSDVVRLLDRVETENGEVMADRVLAAIRKLFNWYATRDDEFVSPVVKGMARSRPKERARERILTDDEIRSIWSLLDDPEFQACFGPALKLLFLTAQRREEVGRLVRAEITGDSWTIPAARYKTKRDHVVPLIPAATAIIECRPKLCDYVFSTNGRTPFSGWSKAKKRLNERSGVQGWTIHDIRRTAKTLMTRSGVSHFVADRVLGHVIAGVQGVYDRYDYLKEKREALNTLQNALMAIIRRSAANGEEAASQDAAALVAAAD